MTDRISPNGPLAKAIQDAIAARHSSEPYATHVAIMKLETAFKRMQGDAEYKSWFAEAAT